MENSYMFSYVLNSQKNCKITLRYYISIHNKLKYIGQICHINVIYLCIMHKFFLIQLIILLKLLKVVDKVSNFLYY